MNQELLIDQLHVSIDGQEIIKGLSLHVLPGSLHALMGSNGSGKSSLAYTIMGHPRYLITQGSIFYKGQDITQMSPDKRAQLGIFLAFQHPYALPGVTVKIFLKESHQAATGITLGVKEFQELLYAAMARLSIDQSFADRFLNEGFSGGEKKRFEMLQLILLKPSLVILDELDSGLDIDALKIVTQSLLAARTDSPSMTIILITHYQKMLNYITPDFVHIMCDGIITKTGSAHLAIELEDRGYDGYRI